MTAAYRAAVPSPSADDSPVSRPRGLLLDMDGTLTVPRIDYDAIKRDMRVPTDRTILETMAEMTGGRLAEAERVLERYEREAAEASELADGCGELLRWLAAEKMPVAVVTRNSRASLETVFRLHDLPPFAAVAREDAAHKPDPAPLLLACRRIERLPQEVWMVGDGRYDVEAGVAAGVRTVWLSLGRDPRPFAAEPWKTVADLPALLALLRNSERDAAY